MKKIIASFIVLGVLLMSTPAHALTISDLMKEIEALRAEISDLKSKMSGQVLGSTVATSPVKILETSSITYKKGMTSPEIAKLQQALIDQKFLAAGNATGYYGELTYQAVKNFQLSKGLVGDGVLGPVTQTELMNICREPITVLSPNGGEFYQAGEKVTVTWKTCENIPATATVRLELEAWGSFPAYFFVNTLNDGNELVTLPTSTTLPGIKYGLGYKIAATYTPKVSQLGEPSFHRDFSDNLFTISTSCTPNSWAIKAYLPGVGRHSAAGFSIDNRGYVGTGWGDGHELKDFWEYNPVYNSWTQKADFGGIARTSAAGFSVSGKGYIGTGSSGSVDGFLLKDFWEYDPSLNTWTQKADFGGEKRSSSVGFSIGSKGYVGLGGFNKTDLWEYSPSTNTWTKKADFPGGARNQATSFSLDGKGYVGTGNTGDSESVKKDFWEYNPITDKWTQKADFGGIARQGAVSFALDGRGYIGSGRKNQTEPVRDFWQYYPALDRWSKKADVLGAHYFGTGFAINNKGYFATGAGSTHLIQYCPE